VRIVKRCIVAPTERVHSGGLPILAHCVISTPQSNQVAFGAKRTSDGRQRRLAQSRMTLAVTQLRHHPSGTAAMRMP
jgi:hypothetical protein